MTSQPTRRPYIAKSRSQAPVDPLMGRYAPRPQAGGMPKNTEHPARVPKSRPPKKNLAVLTQASDGSLVLRADIPLGPRCWAVLRKLWSTLLTLIAGAAAGKVLWP